MMLAVVADAGREERKKKKTAEKKIQHHLVAAVAKPPIRVIKCNGPFACSHLLCGDTKEI